MNRRPHVSTCAVCAWLPLLSSKALAHAGCVLRRVQSREFTMGCGTPLLLRPAVDGVQVARVKAVKAGPGMVKGPALQLRVGQMFSITEPTTVTTPDPACARIEVLEVAMDRDPLFCAGPPSTGLATAACAPASSVRWRAELVSPPSPSPPSPSPPSPSPPLPSPLPPSPLQQQSVARKRALVALATSDCPMFAGERRTTWTRSGRRRCAEDRPEDGPE